MAWRNALELESEHAVSDYSQAAATLFGLREMFRSGLTSPDFRPSAELAQAIVVSPAAAEAVRMARDRFPSATDEEIALGTFLAFYHHDLLIDPLQSDAERMREILGAEIVGGRIRFPWIFGLDLYDRYFELFPNSTADLSAEETERLLDGTPAGVFQDQRTVIGPFGALLSHGTRFLSSTLEPMLWSCSDPGCQALHAVRLTPPSNLARRINAAIRRFAVSREGQPSEWPSFLTRASGSRERYYNSLNTEHFPWLLANAFDLTESRLIAGKLLEQHGKSLRQNLPDTARFKSLLSGSPQNIASRLDKPQALQLSLLAEDDWIIHALEDLIDSKVIQVPPTEIRTAAVSPRLHSWHQITSQCSRLGIRFTPQSYDDSLARLRGLVVQVYETQSDFDSLEFRLRHVAGATVNEKLDNFLYQSNPREVISKLIFVSPKHIQSSFEVLKYGSFRTPLDETDERATIDKMLWKLGFELLLFPTFQEAFWTHLDRFLESARTFRAYTEADQATIRSAGINLFVSLEEVLDYTLSFSAWALLADHYGVTRWRFNLDDSRMFMAHALDGRSFRDDILLQIDPRGRNALFPLIEGFAVLRDLCTEILAKPDQNLRPTAEFPGFVGRSDIERFPFLHTALILDLRPTDQAQILELLGSVTESLNQADVANLRNRLGHRRADFPGQQEIEQCCSQLGETIERLEQAGLCPTVRLLQSVSYDEFGRGVAILHDFRGREVRLLRPSLFGACRLPGFGGPTVVAPCMHIGDSRELLRFRFSESSRFRDMWKGFPKRRTRLPLETAESESGAESADEPNVVIEP